MAFTIGSPTRLKYTATRQGSEAIQTVGVETTRNTRSIQETVVGSPADPEPSVYRITHVSEVVDDDEDHGRFQYIESLDVSTWEHITRAIDVLMTRTRAEG
jgi:hypothetical protein